MAVEKPMEFPVEFDVRVPHWAPASEVEARDAVGASAAAALVNDGPLIRPWKFLTAPGETNGRRPQGNRPGSLRASNDQ
jgi:muconolactone delta-isomerase